jgi:Protein of unknown function (DUF3089)
MTNYKRNFLLNTSGKIILIIPVVYFSCSTNRYIASINYDFKNVKNRPQYDNLEYWAAHPFKYDPSDNTPLADADQPRDSLADVFFIYPTTYTDTKMPMGWNGDINSKPLNEKTDKSTILYQASVFNKYCRVFSPRYRQANLEAFYTKDSAKARAAFDTAYVDVRRAFKFYLAHYNHGRPIIIASHSQGTVHAERLLKEFFENKPLMKQLVCAYLVGMPVFENYFQELKPCKDSGQTGCFVSWRTFREGYCAPYILKEKNKAYVINPLTWSIDTAKAPADLNEGGVLRNFQKVIPGLVHAEIHGNILWVNKPKFFGNIFLTMRNYHIADYNLFYQNIRENVGTRIRSFLEKTRLAKAQP